MGSRLCRCWGVSGTVYKSGCAAAGSGAPGAGWIGRLQGAALTQCSESSTVAGGGDSNHRRAWETGWIVRETSALHQQGQWPWMGLRVLCACLHCMVEPQARGVHWVGLGSSSPVSWLEEASRRNTWEVSVVECHCSRGMTGSSCQGCVKSHQPPCCAHCPTCSVLCSAR